MSTNNYLKIKFKKYNVTYIPSRSEKGQETDDQKEESKKVRVNAFGYYDAMEFKSEDSILGFKPGKDFDFNSDTQELKTEYVLKLVNIGIINGDERAEFWNRENGKIYYPFIAVVSVDLNDELIKGVSGKGVSDKSGLFGKVNYILETVKKDSGFNDYVSAFFCIGYTDIVVILQSNSIEAMHNYITELRKYREKGKSYNCVSSTYTVFGLVKGADKDKISKEEINLTLQWAYKDIHNCFDMCASGDCYDTGAGVSGGFFEKLGDICKPNNYDIEYGIFDRSYKICCSAENVYSLFDDSKMDNNPYRSNNSGIKIFNTKLNFDNGKKTGEEGKTPESVSRAKETNVRNALKKFLKAYWVLIVNNHLHKRLFSAMKNMEEYYELIVTSEHSEDIELIVGDFYKKSLDSFEEVIKHLNNKTEQIGYFEEALEKFRGCVQFLLFDILRSDHSYFEVPSIAHPSIGSTTKLLLAYNRIVNKWNDAFSKQNNVNGSKDKGSKFTFLVTSGGCDGTTVTNILWRFEDKELTGLDCCLPVIIAIPEASLYDFKGTIARIAHEFFHFRGNRLRKGITLDNGKKILGRYGHFYRGLLYEYLDYCCATIGKKDNSSRLSAGLSDKKMSPLTAKDFEKYIKNFPVYTASDDTDKKKFRHEEKDIKGNGEVNYAVLAGKQLQQKLFGIVEDISEITDFIDACCSISVNLGSGESGDVAKRLSELAASRGLLNNTEVSNQQYSDFYNLVKNKKEYNLEDFLEEGLDKYFKNLKPSPDIKFLKDDIKKVLKKYKYDSEVFDIVNLFDELYHIIDSLPNDAYRHAISKINIIPQGIYQLGAVFCKIAYDKQAELRSDKINNLGIAYTFNNYGLDEFNVTKEPKDVLQQNGVDPMTDYYSREWYNASLKFFLEAPLKDPDRDRPMNYHNYRQFLVKLYRECYADLCALCLLCKINGIKYLSTKENTRKFELFTEYVGAFLYEQLDIDKLFGIDESDEEIKIDPAITLRICAVYEAFMGDISEGNNRKDDLTKYLVAHYKAVNNVEMEEEDRQKKCKKIHDKIESIFIVYKQLRDKKKFVFELVEYLGNCKSFAFNEVKSWDSLILECGGDENKDWLLDSWLDIYKRKGRKNK